MSETPDDRRGFPFVCPLCGGGLRENPDDPPRAFECHVGHRFSSAEMEREQVRALQDILLVAVRALSERALMCQRYALDAYGEGRYDRANRWSDLRREVELRAEVIRRMLDYGWGIEEPAGPP